MFSDTEDGPKPTFQQYLEGDSGFKAWENDSLIAQNHTNLLRNFKSQLLLYEEKYRKLDSNKTVPIKLPTLEYLKPKKYKSNNPNKSNTHTIHPENPLTQRHNLQPPQTQNLYQHKSIELNKKPSLSKEPRRFTSQKCKQRQSNTIDHSEQKNQPVTITKVQQMKFTENQKRVRKRDLYLAIFGERGKAKVQKIQFDDENQAYHTYLERKNQQAKLSVGHVVIELDKHKIRCSTQLNNRNPIKKPEVLGQSVSIMTKNNSHLPMRY